MIVCYYESDINFGCPSAFSTPGVGVAIYFYHPSRSFKPKLLIGVKMWKIPFKIKRCWPFSNSISRFGIIITRYIL